MKDQELETKVDPDIADPVDMKKLTQARIYLERTGHSLTSSLISTREEFLKMPHLGKKLSLNSIHLLEQLNEKYDLVFSVSDGLSASAIENHFIPFWKVFAPLLIQYNFKIAPIILIPFGRVAVGNHAGEMLGAKVSAIFIGERPGLSSQDSMGIYLTYAPNRESKDSESNCLSNIRPPHGLSYEEGAKSLLYLILESMKLKYSGVNLKLNTDKILLKE